MFLVHLVCSCSTIYLLLKGHPYLILQLDLMLPCINCFFYNYFSEFIYEFLKRLSELNECDRTHSCCKNAYNDTLAKHHPWVVRKGAVVAMYALPTQGELLKRVCINVSRAIEVLPEMLKHTKSVYDRIELLYTAHDLHDLP